VAVRVGQGIDVHAFAVEATGALVLGGVEIPDGPPLEGHSDGDVVLHALTDALLGAAGLGDLGELVGVDEPAVRGASSSAFVRAAMARLAAAGWRVGNADLTVVALRPRLASLRPAIRASVAELLEVPEDAVNCKATTTDGLGALGRAEGIACLAVVLLEPATTK
jgi:2-C-methyl-D-erythritol 2,4-cyclodiphosphate synthase